MRALVLSGGGVDGVFGHGGALHALGRTFHKPPSNVFQRISGASAGATAATYTAVRREHRILELAETIRPEDLFASDRPARALRRAKRVHDRAALLNPKGLRKLMVEEFPDRWLSQIPAGQLVIPTCDLRTQQMVEWRPEEVPPAVFRRALLASMSIPIVFPAVEISHGGVRYELVDGGTTHNHPVDLVLPDLAEAKRRGEPVEMVVISALQPPVESDLPESGPSRVMAVIQRVASAVMHELGNLRREEAEEMEIPQHWIQIDSPDLDLENFTYIDALAAYQAGFEAVESHFKRRPAK